MHVLNTDLKGVYTYAITLLVCFHCHLKPITESISVNPLNNKQKKMNSTVFQSSMATTMENFKGVNIFF